MFFVVSLGLRTEGSHTSCSLERAWNGHQEISSIGREGQNGRQERRGEEEAELCSNIIFLRKI